jgi:Kef-type K+ transport system membrane component KefB
MALIFAGMALYALLAHLLGIHALTGGFIWGFLLPDDAALRKDVASRVRDLALIFFLPVFFAQAGFATDLTLLRLDTLPVLLVFLGAAVLGKFASAVPAGWFGLKWSQVLSLGALFNTRGLLVLVVGLLGLEYQIITSLTFTLIVVTALVTNLMTLPVLNAVSQTEKLRSLEKKAGD